MASDQALKNLGGNIPMRFKQIAVAQSMSESDSGERLVGLADDGSVWEYRCRAVQKTRMLAHVSGTPVEQRYNEYRYWWQPLRMSDQPGPEYEEPALPI
jgi:hypothetical protein